MIRVRWETDTKYYEVRLRRDLLHDWVLIVSRGSKTSRLGALRTIFVSSEEEGIQKIEALDKQRTRHGYVRVPYLTIQPPFQTTDTLDDSEPLMPLDATRTKAESS
jgi:hypothetical protein